MKEKVGKEGKKKRGKEVGREDGRNQKEPNKNLISSGYFTMH